MVASASASVPRSGMKPQSSIDRLTSTAAALVIYVLVAGSERRRWW
jgi:hypothetical protein